MAATRAMMKPTRSFSLGMSVCFLQACSSQSSSLDVHNGKHLLPRLVNACKNQLQDAISFKVYRLDSAFDGPVQFEMQTEGRVKEKYVPEISARKKQNEMPMTAPSRWMREIFNAMVRRRRCCRTVEWRGCSLWEYQEGRN
jgi:hypothetical protein